MKIFNKKNNNKGFTLIETMVAVFILTMALSSLLTVNASSIFAARYSRNEITANYLLQEVIDYIRNDRDSSVLYASDTAQAWTDFETKYSNCMGNFSSSGGGCYFEPASTSPSITACGSSNSGFGALTCPLLKYDDNATNNDFYTYQSGSNVNFKRQILMQINNNNGGNEIDVKATVEWLNGNLVRSRSLQVSLLRWK